MELHGDVTESVEDELRRMAPWMNPFRLRRKTIVGFFKHHGLPGTVLTSSDGADTQQSFNDAFDDYMRGQPYWLIDELLAHLGDPTEHTFLEIGCGTGRYVFDLALRGAAQVVGVDIRRHNIAQAEYLQQFDRRLARLSTIEVRHEPQSADDDGYLAGYGFDVVLMTVFPMLKRPIDQLMNVARIARRAALFHIRMTAAPPEMWQLGGFGDTGGAITGTVGGWSWVPPAAGFAHVLRCVGFGTVMELVHPLVRPFRDAERGEPGRTARLLLPGALAYLPRRVAAPRQRARAAQLRLRYADPYYYTFLAFK